MSRKAICLQIITTGIFKNFFYFVRDNRYQKMHKQIDFTRPCVCTLITHRGPQNVAKRGKNSSHATRLWHVLACSEWTPVACIRL